MAYDLPTMAAINSLGYGGGAGGMDVANMTQDQLDQAMQKRRQLMYAQSLMAPAGGAAPTSFAGGFAQGFRPGFGSWLQQGALTRGASVPPQMGGLY